MQCVTIILLRRVWRQEVRAIKFYIATKLENWQAHNWLRDRLLDAGHEITYDWTVHGPVYSKGLGEVCLVAHKEAKGVRDADIVIMLWPGGRGTHVELGMALAHGKPVFFVSDVEEHHEATAETCAFYHHCLVIRSKTVEEFLELYCAWRSSDERSS